MRPQVGVLGRSARAAASPTVAALDLDDGLLAGERPQRRGNQNSDWHALTPLQMQRSVLRRSADRSARSRHERSSRGRPLADRDDDVAQIRPGVLEIERRRHRRVIGMRVIEAERARRPARPARASARRYSSGPTRKRRRRSRPVVTLSSGSASIDLAVARADQRAAALVRVGGARRARESRRATSARQRRSRRPRRSSQNGSDR